MHLQTLTYHPEVNAITGLRGFAAMWVFIFHFWGSQVIKAVNIEILGWQFDITWCFTFGWLGVPIFFVLSGYLLAQPFIKQAGIKRSEWKTESSQARPRISLRAYFVRRVLRVFPAYYGQLFILVLLAYFFQYGRYPEDAASWIAHLTMTFFSPPYFISGINGVWWTLPIEFGFYLLLPLFAVMLKPGRGLALLFLCLSIMLCYRYFIYFMYLATDVPLYTRVSLLPGVMDSFGIGMYAAYLSNNLPAKLIGSNSITSELLHQRQNLVASAATVAMLLGFGGCMLIMQKYWMFYWVGGWMSYSYTALFSAVIGCGLVGASLGSSWLEWLFGNRLMRFLGNISYSMYLWHVPVIGTLKLFPKLQEIGAHRNSILLGLCTIVLIFISWLSWRFIELPGIAWGRRLTRNLAH